MKSLLMITTCFCLITSAMAAPLVPSDEEKLLHADKEWTSESISSSDPTPFRLEYRKWLDSQEEHEVVPHKQMVEDDSVVVPLPRPRPKETKTSSFDEVGFIESFKQFDADLGRAMTEQLNKYDPEWGSEALVWKVPVGPNGYAYATVEHYRTNVVQPGQARDVAGMDIEFHPWKAPVQQVVVGCYQSIDFTCIDSISPVASVSSKYCYDSIDLTCVDSIPVITGDYDLGIPTKLEVAQDDIKRIENAIKELIVDNSNPYERIVNILSNSDLYTSMRLTEYDKNDPDYDKIMLRATSDMFALDKLVGDLVEAKARLEEVTPLLQ